MAAFLAKVAKEDSSLLDDWTPAEEKRLLRWKIDPIVMTLSQFALMMGAVDKVCIGTAAVLGMRKDLNLVGQQYRYGPSPRDWTSNKIHPLIFSWISSVVYFGAIAAVFPSLFIMQKVATAKWISLNCAVWGIILMCSAASRDYG